MKLNQIKVSSFYLHALALQTLAPHTLALHTRALYQWVPRLSGWRRPVSLITRVLATLLMSGAATADDQISSEIISKSNAGQPTAIEEEIIVTATRSPYSLDRVATTVRIIDQQDIARSGVHTVADLLRNHSAVQVRDSSGIDRASSLSLRGFSASQNLLVLVDGRKLNNTDLGGPDLSAVNLGDVERIEILEGGAGALYGDQAVGGVINIITRRGGSAGGRLKVGRGSYDNESYQASYRNELASGIYYRVNTELERSDAYRDDTSLNTENYSALLGYRYRSGEVFVEGRQMDSEHLLAGGLFTSQVSTDRRQAGSSFNAYAVDNRVARIGIHQRLGELVELRASYSDRNETAVINSHSGFGDAVSWQERRVKLFDPRLILSLDRLRVTLGLDKERVDYGFTLDFGFGPSGTKQRHDKKSEYLHLLFSPRENLDLQAGVRHAQLDIDVEPFGVTYEQSVTVHNIGVSWRPGSWASELWGGGSWRVYLNRDETFRFPLADENVDFFGNLNLLDVQRGVAWELGSQWVWASTQLSLALFQHDNENEIAYDPMLGLYGANTNLDDTLRRGATVEFVWQANDKVSWHTVYTYTDATFDEGVYDGNRIPDVARHLAKLNASYQISEAVNLFAEIIYVGARQLDFANTTDELGGYSVFNLAATWQLSDWTLQARVNNIGQKEYSEFTSFYGVKALFPSAERSLMVTLAYDF